MPFAVAALAVIAALVYHYLARVAGLPFLLNLDDGYIHVRLAANFAEFGKIGINPGEGGGGSSSLLWTFILALGTVLGFATDKFAWFLSLSGLGVAVWAAARISSALLPTWLSIIASITVAISGQLITTALSGMESTFYLAFVLLTLDSFIRKRIIATTLFSAIAVLLRPESVFIALAIFVSSMFSGQSDPLENGRSKRLTILPFVSAIVAGVLSYTLLTWLGEGAPQTLAARRWLIGLDPSFGANLSRNFAGAIRCLGLLNVRITDYVGPGHGLGIIWSILVYVLAGFAVIMTFRKFILWRTISIFLFFHLMFYLVLLPVPGHFGRYFAPLWALGPLLVMQGWLTARQYLRDSRMIQVSTYVLAFIILANLPQLWKWAKWHVDTVNHLDRIHYSMAKTVRDQVPAGETIAVFDVGLMAWIGGHRIVDVAGLTDPEGLEALKQHRITELLVEKEIRYIILPEGEGVQRWVLAQRVGIPVQMLHEIHRLTLGTKWLDHIMPTLVAMRAMGLYEFRPSMKE